MPGNKPQARDFDEDKISWAVVGLVGNLHKCANHFLGEESISSCLDGASLQVLEDSKKQIESDIKEKPDEIKKRYLTVIAVTNLEIERRQNNAAKFEKIAKDYLQDPFSQIKSQKNNWQAIYNQTELPITEPDSKIKKSSKPDANFEKRAAVASLGAKVKEIKDAILNGGYKDFNKALLELEKLSNEVKIKAQAKHKNPFTESEVLKVLKGLDKFISDQTTEKQEQKIHSALTEKFRRK